MNIIETIRFIVSRQTAALNEMSFVWKFTQFDDSLGARRGYGQGRKW
jgi:hypothetical protein